MKLKRFQRAMENTPPEIREQVKKEMDIMDDLQLEIDDLKIELSDKEIENERLQCRVDELTDKCLHVEDELKQANGNLLVAEKKIVLLDEVLNFITAQRDMLKEGKRYAVILAWIFFALFVIASIIKK